MQAILASSYGPVLSARLSLSCNGLTCRVLSQYLERRHTSIKSTWKIAVAPTAEAVEKRRPILRSEMTCIFILACSIMLQYERKPRGLRRHSAAQVSTAPPFPIPPDLLPGTLTRSHTRCGNPRCHCSHQKGMRPGPDLHGERPATRPAHPRDWVVEVQQRVAAGREISRRGTRMLAATPSF